VPPAYSPRKLLIAAIGVATINYVACKESTPTSGNLPAPREMPDAEPTPVAGNLPAPPPQEAGPPTTQPEAGPIIPPTSGNLPAPQPRDAGVVTKPDAGAKKK
jgi:hypothetical protein